MHYLLISELFSPGFSDLLAGLPASRLHLLQPLSRLETGPSLWLL